MAPNIAQSSMQRRKLEVEAADEEKISPEVNPDVSF